MERCHSIRNKVQLLKVGLLSCFFKEKIFRSGIGNLCGRGRGDERVDSARRQSFRFIVYIDWRKKSKASRNAIFLRECPRYLSSY